ncbi:serine/threonine receptor-like kinase NFP [Phoenix dactylifera]|uniref:Serine/threonine receptor-like kinase NFP n=1 Tax=Phoenix dactylifera TaxID=42345 RepID=A0A8B9A8D5_PHODC|nr:serine/threonine receptor-like kinase NFP [Phoenix dactylifera]
MRRDGAHPLLPLLLLLFLALILPSSHAQSGSSRPGTDNYNCAAEKSVYPCRGFTCIANRSVYPCRAYALYRASGGDDLASVSDLFGVSTLSIARASNITDNSTAVLSSGQPLLVPLICSCVDNHSYALVDYQIKGGDTFYILSTTNFQNLTGYQAVELVNPTLVPTNLSIGVITVFPIFCQCPNNTNTLINDNSSTTVSIVSYVFQPSDSYSSIASNFGTTVQSLISLNGAETAVENFSVILIPVSKFPPPLLLSNSSSPSPSPSPPPPPSSTVVEKRDRTGVIVGLAVGMGLFAILLALVLVLFLGERKKRRREARKRKGDGGWNNKGGGERRFARSGSDVKLMTDISELLDKYKLYQIEELRRATSDFDYSCLIQGTVYKGTIDGEVFAIKKMKWNACEELKILQKVNHTNLVKLEGFCIDPEDGTCYLVYEYVANGSLHSWLHDAAPTRRLDWRSRLRIALDLAHGLQYIHEHTWPRVVHKDIKSSNVLLDSKLHAKIANFGLAKTGINAVTTHIVGTQGYIAPEYLADGLVTTKMDVFAYGVVLLELISGKEAVSEEGEALWVEAEVVFQRTEANVVAWMDPVLREQSCPIDTVVTVLNVAKACLQRDPSKRPTMVDVAYTLSKADEQFSDYSGDGLSVGSEDVSVLAR